MTWSSALPSAASTRMETVVFLFTDIEGSTALWETVPDAMRLALARHDAIVQEQVTAQGGLVLKTAGDAFYTVFPDVSSALACAIAIQRTLADEASGELPVL